MKNFIVLLITCLLLIGCGNVKKEEIVKPQKEIEKYSLVSSDSRLVFKNENTYEIVYYENDKVFKVETAIKFNTPAEAERYFKEESYGNSETIRYVYDVFIVEETNDYWEDYKDLSREELVDYMKKAEYEYIY